MTGENLVNLVEKEDKYGGSCFVCFENKKILQSLIKSGYKPNDSIDFKIVEANLEELLILKINPKQLEHPSTPKSMPRIQIIGKHKYNGVNWEGLLISLFSFSMLFVQHYTLWEMILYWKENAEVPIIKQPRKEVKK